MFKQVSILLIVIAGLWSLPSLPTIAQDDARQDCIAYGFQDGFSNTSFLTVWDINTGQRYRPTQPVMMPNAEYSPDGFYAAYFWLNENSDGNFDSYDATLMITDLNTGEAWVLADNLEVNTAWYVVDIAWASDSYRIAASGGQNSNAILLTATIDGTMLLITEVESIQDTLQWAENDTIIYDGMTRSAATHESVKVPWPPINEEPTPTFAPRVDAELLGVDDLTLMSIAPFANAGVYSYQRGDGGGVAVVKLNDFGDAAQWLLVDNADRPEWDSTGSRLVWARQASTFHWVLEVFDVERMSFTHITTVANASETWRGDVGWAFCND